MILPASQVTSVASSSLCSRSFCRSAGPIRRAPAPAYGAPVQEMLRTRLDRLVDLRRPIAANSASVLPSIGERTSASHRAPSAIASPAEHRTEPARQRCFEAAFSRRSASVGRRALNRSPCVRRHDPLLNRVVSWRLVILAKAIGQETLRSHLLLPHEARLRQAPATCRSSTAQMPGGRRDLDRAPDSRRRSADDKSCGRRSSARADPCATSHGAERDHDVLKSHRHGALQISLNCSRCSLSRSSSTEQLHLVAMAHVADRLVVQFAHLAGQSVAQRAQPAAGVERFVAHAVERECS